MNEFDQFVKHELKIKHYVRYTDDFMIVAETKTALEKLLPQIAHFLYEKLILRLHPKKITIRPLHQGIDFLGYVLLPHYRVLRTKTRRRIFKKLRECIVDYKNGVIERQTLEQSIQSYFGVLSHANTYDISQELANNFWFWL